MATTHVGGTTTTTAREARWAASLLSGLIASQIGGLIMAAAMMAVYRFWLDQPLLRPVEIIGTYLFGDAALDRSTTVMLVAAVLFHQGICAVWGVVYGLVAPLLRVYKSRGGAIMLGIVIGLASQVVDINLVTPPLMERLYGHNLWMENVPPLVSWAGHVIFFGLGFAFFTPIFRKLWLRFAGRQDLLYEDPRIR